MSRPLIVSASGVRGVVGEGLVPDVAARYGLAFGTWLAGDEGHVLVGRDSRTSGPVLLDAAAAGLRAAGWDVRDLGLVPTPTALLAAGDDPAAAGALIVTASHNPVEWNGLKLGGPEGRFLSREAGAAVERLFEEGVAGAAWDALGDRTRQEGAVEHHIRRILDLPEVEPERVAAAGLTVALDCVRGAGGVIMPALLEALGCRVAGLDLEPDGRFPRDPEPTAVHLGALGEAVRRRGADLGMAVDPDVDRLALVDETGRPVGEDWTLALAAELVLARRPGPVVTNLSSSRCIADAAERAGRPCWLAPVGEAHVVQAMVREGAAIGGEGNGGVIFPPLHLTRDAPLAAALTLQLLAERDRPLGAILEGWPRYHIAKAKLERPEGPVEPLLERLEEEAPSGARRDRRDGLRLDWPDGRWLHVRPSGTEPILRVVAEAPEAEAARALVEWTRRAAAS